ncbi:hypothetical protein BLNAU_5432 [Blattamonas nauphoetae]|uniref:Protein kinase domain-containing protein n=1 Tax=Blattamonas nauphoetae TaxID=2049346 RepID=A0ABQ9Y7J4_9EUKA|nr:hypothetical protein BLNAU_5432 [Blattamonas nauphoetae]
MISNPQYSLDPTKYDIWAVGCLLFELALGYDPLEGHDVQTLLNSLFHRFGNPRFGEIPSISDSTYSQFVFYEPADEPFSQTILRADLNTLNPLLLPLYLGGIPPNMWFPLIQTLRALLCFSPSQRPSASEALNLPLFTFVLPQKPSPISPQTLYHIMKTPSLKSSPHVASSDDYTQTPSPLPRSKTSPAKYSTYPQHFSPELDLVEYPDETSHLPVDDLRPWEESKLNTSELTNQSVLTQSSENSNISRTRKRTRTVKRTSKYIEEKTVTITTGRSLVDGSYESSLSHKSSPTLVTRKTNKSDERQAISRQTPVRSQNHQNHIEETPSFLHSSSTQPRSPQFHSNPSPTEDTPQHRLRSTHSPKSRHIHQSSPYTQAKSQVGKGRKEDPSNMSKERGWREDRSDIDKNRGRGNEPTPKADFHSTPQRTHLLRSPTTPKESSAGQSFPFVVSPSRQKTIQHSSPQYEPGLAGPVSRIRAPWQE